MSAGRRIVVLDVPAEDAELAADMLWQAGPSAVSEAEGASGRVHLTADVELDENLFQRTGWEVRMLEPDGDEHLDAWRAWATAIRAGRRVVLQPAWVPAEPASEDDVVVRLDPGRTFGSGSHPSTRLVAAELERLVAGGETVLDVGCGSGVLAVTALRLGAGSAVGVDVEPECVRVGLANAAANGVASRFTVSTTPVEEVTGAFDLVLANIGLGVLRQLAGPVAARLAPGGCLVLAGLLDEQVDDALTAYSGLSEVSRSSEAGWSAVVLRSQGTTATTSESRTGRYR